MRKIIISLFFLALLASSLAGLILKNKTFFKESPFLPQRPAFSRNALLDKNFYKDLEAYINFRYPFRASYIRSKSWLDMSIFKTSPTSKVHQGLNGWLYFRPAIQSFLKSDCLQKGRAMELAKTLHELELRLNNSGRRFVFIVAPDKATIYPEYMGGVRERNNCEMSFYDLFLDALDKYPVKGFIRLDRALIKAKGPSLLYYKAGIHWNDRGASLAGELILKKLSTPELSFHLPKITFSKRKVLSELSMMLFNNVYEYAPVAGKLEFSEEVRTTGIKAMPFFPDEWAVLRTETYAKGARLLLPKTLIYRDSFMTGPMNFIKGSFREIHARWSKTFPEAIKVEAKEIATAKIIIIEIVEKDLSKLRIRPELAMKQIKMQA